MHCKNRRGFTLVEMAVVVMIAGLILAISAPNLIRHLNRQRVHDAAHVLADEMRLARQKAVANGTRNYIYTQYGTGQNQYWTGLVTQQTNGVWPSSIAWKGPIDLPDKTRQIGANFSGYVYFYYDPSGRPRQPLTGNPPPLSSGSVKFVSTVPGVTDTTTINLDLSGSVW
jgi:prepilin-type N-terminal cleavage/methylation domain-containing protein